MKGYPASCTGKIWSGVLQPLTPGLLGLTWKAVAHEPMLVKTGEIIGGELVGMIRCFLSYYILSPGTVKSFQEFFPENCGAIASAGKSRWEYSGKAVCTALHRVSTTQLGRMIRHLTNSRFRRMIPSQYACLFALPFPPRNLLTEPL